MRQEFFPDGTPISPWFYEVDKPSLADLGRAWSITDHGVRDDGQVYTEAIQALIDRIAGEGGGVVVVPRGTYLTGSLFFRQGVHLYVAEGGVLKGSDDISDYALMPTRIEGECCTYYAALINADGVDGFTMMGPGTIDGNGLRAWKAFWLRRRWNPKCTNKDEQRPRLVYISNSRNVLVADLHLQNSHFWTNHLYRCDHVKYLGCTIYAPAAPVRAPSSDALDIDVCTDVLVKNCYLEVNDDSVVLKGGKGPWADTAPENGSNERIIIEDCEYGFCHGCLTCGSESVHNRNVILRRVHIGRASNLLWLKMRPDTPQRYEHILISDVEGCVGSFINVNPWTQFFDLKDRKDPPMSYADRVTIERCRCECSTFLNVRSCPDQYELTGFTLRDVQVRTVQYGWQEAAQSGWTMERVQVELKE